MTSKPRHATTALLALAAAAAFMAPAAQAQARKDSAVLAMVLEPAPGLDPTTAAAAAIGEEIGRASCRERVLMPV